MLEFLKEKKPTQLNKDAPASENKELRQVRRRVLMQLGLAVLTVVLTVVIVFGMTAAWYTNVVQSSGLIFEVEKLGVNVEADVTATTFTAQPGDEGIIGLTAKNNGDEIVAITVSINKSTLDSRMQQRLYFFVEQQSTVDGETAQRTYLTNSGSFTYTVFGGNTLHVTQDYHNASSLKWCWVYDVLGYYVLGQKSEDGTTVQVQEYLRPIEYDYDNATFDADGNLLTVDGTTTAMEFLTALSATDGYTGTIDAATEKVGGYYQVDVDENGYGIYAYLCTRAEAEANTDYDTELGQAALDNNAATYSVRVTVLAQVLEAAYTSVSTADDLAAAIAGGEEYIRLTADTTLASTQKLTVAGNSQVFLDLNGYTLTTQSTSSAVVLEKNASLTVTNGTVSGAAAGNVFQLTGADLTLDGVTLTGNNAIRIDDHLASGQDSVVRVTNCEMELSGHGVMLFGNGTDSTQTTQVVLENTKITAAGYPLAGNGTATRWGTDVQIIGCTLTSVADDALDGYAYDYAAIYHPQDGVLNIQSSTLAGATGVSIKGGTVTIANSYVYGTDTNPEDPTETLSGSSDTGAALFVDTTYGYDISVTVRDTHLESYYGQAYRVYVEGAANLTQSVSEDENNNIFVNESKQATT